MSPLAMTVDPIEELDCADNGRKFQCPVPTCGRRFNRKYTLTEHLKTHTGEKPFACRVAGCGKRFSTSGNLSRHRRLHGPLEPLECPADGCDFTFTSELKRDRHVKFHHGDRTRQCAVLGCGKTFSTTGNLNRHLKNHHTESERMQVSEPCVGSPTASVSSTLSANSPTTVDSEWSACGESWFENEPTSEAASEWTPEMLDILAQMLLD